MPAYPVVTLRLSPERQKAKLSKTTTGHTKVLCGPRHQNFDCFFAAIEFMYILILHVTRAAFLFSGNRLRLSFDFAQDKYSEQKL